MEEQSKAIVEGKPLEYPEIVQDTGRGRVSGDNRFCEEYEIEERNIWISKRRCL